LGDKHEKWGCPKTEQAFLTELVRGDYDYIVQMGDAFDFFSASRFARTHDLITPEDEIRESFEKLTKFWDKVRKLKKSHAQMIMLLGNHETRPWKRLLDQAPELLTFMDMKKYFRFPEVIVAPDAKSEIKLEGIIFHHGWLAKLGDHAKYFNESCVVGHTHVGGVVYHARGDGKVIWELNAGLAADRHSTPMKYRETTYCKWTNGFAIIDELGPRFCPISIVEKDLDQPFRQRLLGVDGVK
jgi:hypothetical protein